MHRTHRPDLIGRKSKLEKYTKQIQKIQVPHPPCPGLLVIHILASPSYFSSAHHALSLFIGVFVNSQHLDVTVTKRRRDRSLPSPSTTPRDHSNQGHIPRPPPKLQLSCYANSNAPTRSLPFEKSRCDCSCTLSCFGIGLTRNTLTCFSQYQNVQGYVRCEIGTKRSWVVLYAHRFCGRNFSPLRRPFLPDRMPDAVVTAQILLLFAHVSRHLMYSLGFHLITIHSPSCFSFSMVHKLLIHVVGYLLDNE
jgi:hypothetical protein